MHRADWEIRMELEPKVKAGVEWLDTFWYEDAVNETTGAPRGAWANLIRLDELDLNCSHSCVLGQLYNSYHSSPLYERGMPVYDGDTLGFDISASDCQDEENCESRWRVLTELWTDLIAARRAGKGSR